MGKIGIGLNLEAVRTSHKSFEWGVQFAKELGYEYIEPMVHWGRELLSEARYFHSVSMLDDPFRVRDAVEAAGLKLSALSSHSQLSKPEIAVEYLKQAARFAKECGAPIINTHEGHKQTWTTEEEDFVLTRLWKRRKSRPAGESKSVWKRTRRTRSSRTSTNESSTW